MDDKSAGLGNYFVCKKFAVQILLWSLELMIQICDWARHHCSLNLGLKLKYLNMSDLCFAK